MRERISIVNFRMKDEDLELAKNRMQSLGMYNLSEYIRKCLLGDDIASIHLLRDISKEVNYLRHRLDELHSQELTPNEKSHIKEKTNG